jgi:alkylhydroperoxidase family enzyme
MRYDDFRKRLVDAVLNAPGDTPEALRRAVLEHARETPGAKGNLPASLAHYVDTVARHAYKVTDADVAALQQAGQSDDNVFEITVAAAVGAALHRLDRGMAALRGEEPD